MLITIDIRRSYPRLGLIHGDILIVDSERPKPTVQRDAAFESDAIFTLLEDGGAEILTPNTTTSDLAAVIALSRPPSPSHTSAPPPASA